MKLLPLKSNLPQTFTEVLPLTVYTVGTEIQPPITRMKGFSAHQLFLTVSGKGRFRRLTRDKDKWDILESGDLLYIPAGAAHEYTAVDGEPWQVAYVTFVENFGGIVAGWGFHDAPRKLAMRDTALFLSRIQGIWSCSGSEHEPWQAAELLMSLLLAVMKANRTARPATPESAPPPAYRESAVHAAVQFIQDHLNRPITIAQLAEHAGYSQKQLTRLFRKELGMTPLQYLHQRRMHAGQMLLSEYPDLTIRQAAAYVGMEPAYFTRLYKRTFRSLPSART